MSEIHTSIKRIMNQRFGALTTIAPGFSAKYVWYPEDAKDVLQVTYMPLGVTLDIVDKDIVKFLGDLPENMLPIVLHRIFNVVKRGGSVESTYQLAVESSHSTPPKNIPTLESRLLRLQIDMIRPEGDGSRWGIYGPYTAPFIGATILEAVEIAEKQFKITY